jgi:PadR family transcriptional regulator, regulatory protein PadR
VNARLGGFELTEGAVYPALHRLEDLGLLISDWAPVGGRRRRLYRISEQGQFTLKAQRRDWRALVGAIESVLGPKDAAAVSS